MTDFKIGDVAWYFQFPEDGCGGFDVTAITLESRKLLDNWDVSQLYLEYSYHSYAEAINAMSKRLAEITEEISKEQE